MKVIRVFAVVSVALIFCACAPTMHEANSPGSSVFQTTNEVHEKIGKDVAGLEKCNTEQFDKMSDDLKKGFDNLSNQVKESAEKQYNKTKDEMKSWVKDQVDKL